jgi:hypothetical protein
MDRYSFLVRLFHPLLYAGLSRRYPERGSAPRGLLQGTRHAWGDFLTKAKAAAVNYQITLMHTRRFATLLLGMWLAGSLFMYAVATTNFQAVDRLLSEPDPSASQMVKVLGNNSARMLLRHQVSEINRSAFNNWERVQLVLGMVLLVTLLFDTNGDKVYMGLCAFLLLLIMVEHFLLTPHLTAVGKTLDFIPAEEPSTARIKFGRFHQAYAVVEVAKMLLLLGLSGRLLMLSQRRRSRKKIKPVNNADNG